MPTRRTAARALVRALRPVIESHHERHGPQTVRASITYLSGSPGSRVFVAEVHGYPLTLTESNTNFGQNLVFYDFNTGLAVGDTLLCVEMGEDDWTAIDAESDTDP